MKLTATVVSLMILSHPAQAGPLRLVRNIARQAAAVVVIPPLKVAFWAAKNLELAALAGKPENQTLRAYLYTERGPEWPAWEKAKK